MSSRDISARRGVRTRRLLLCQEQNAPTFFYDYKKSSNRDGFLSIYSYLCHVIDDLLELLLVKHLLCVILLLVALCCCTTDADRQRMRAGLAALNDLNRNDQPFSPRDVEPYVSFFDDHGTPNDRLLAHYLLGRAYHEAGEAPMALECYHEATDCADTTSRDCDFAQLSRVYAQMARIFYDEGLYQQQLQNIKTSVSFSWQAKDTLAALMTYEQECFAYRRLGMSDSVIMIAEDVSQKYKRHGYPAHSAISLGIVIRTLIDEKSDFQKAKAYIERYESESGFFDSIGNIERGREIYYKLKGLYYLNINRYDSAEFYFRKELHDGKDFNNQHASAKGLAELYFRLHKADSAAKYYQYAYVMNDSVYAQKETKEVKRIQAMYDYTRQQEIANTESRRAESANKKSLLSLVVLLIFSLIASWLYIAKKQVVENLKSTSAELYAAREELANLLNERTTSHQTIKEKEDRIKNLEQKLGRYAKLIYFGSKKIENDMMESPNYQRVKDIAYIGQQLSEDDWTIIKKLFEEYLPGFYDFMMSKTTINTIEYRICLLLRLHFKTGEVANMLDVSPAYISKISSELYKKIFNKKGSSKELAKTLAKIT